MRSRAPLIGLGVAVLLALLFWFFVYSPTSDEIEAVRSETATLETQRQSLVNEIAQLREIEENQVQIRAALARLEEYIPSGTAQSTAVREFQLAADAAGVEILSLAFSEPELVEGAPPSGVPNTALARIPVEMTVEGGYFQVVDLLRRLEVEVPRAALLANVALEEGEEAFPSLRTAWTGSLFGVVPVPPPDVPAELPPEGGDAQPTDGATPTEEATP